MRMRQQDGGARACSHESVCTAESLVNNPHWDPDEGANEVKSVSL